MKVIFLEHVLNVAKKGEVKEVSPGYASNYLFPKKLAKPFTQAIKKQMEQKKQYEESARRMLLGDKREIIDTLSGQTFIFYVPGKGEKIYGSVSQKDVAEYIQKKYHFPLSKKHIDFGEGVSHFKKAGEYDIYIDLGNNYAGKAHITVIAQENG